VEFFPLTKFHFPVDTSIPLPNLNLPSPSAPEKDVWSTQSISEPGSPDDDEGQKGDEGQDNGEDDFGDDFGDDFDDFEEGAEDADFDDFEDGFQQAEPTPAPVPVAPAAAPPSPTVILPFVRLPIPWPPHPRRMFC